MATRVKPIATGIAALAVATVAALSQPQDKILPKICTGYPGSMQDVYCMRGDSRIKIQSYELDRLYATICVKPVRRITITVLYIYTQLSNRQQGYPFGEETLTLDESTPCVRRIFDIAPKPEGATDQAGWVFEVRRKPQ